MRWDSITLLVLITPVLNGVICDMALKEPALHIYLWQFDRELLENNAYKHRAEGARVKIRADVIRTNKVLQSYLRM